MPLQKDSEIYRNIEPLIQRQIDAAIAASNGASSLSPSTTAFLKRTGDTITGNIAVSPGVTVDGVDIDVAISALQSTVAATKAFAYSGLGLSNTDDGVTYTLILTSSSNPGAAAAILASNASGGIQLTRLGVGVTDGTSAAIHALSASIAQLRLSYDTNNYTPFTVSSAGALTIAPTGGTPANAHLYLNQGGNVSVGFATAATAELEVRSLTEQLRLSYTGSVYATHTVNSAGNYTIEATGGNVYTTSHLAHPSYSSQTTNWRISLAGEADFRYIYTDELHAKAFIADLEQALAGGQIVSKSVAKIYAAFAAPTAGNTANLDVEEFAGFAAFHVFADGDLIRIRQFDRSGGGLKISDIWGTVVYSAQVAGSNPPAQRYVFTRSGTYPGTGSGTISAGVLALDYGTTGNGYLEQNAIDGASGINSPYYQGVTWTTHPKAAAPNGLNVKFRLGQLRGLTGNDEYGLYAGTGWTAAPNEGNVSQYTTTAPTADDAHRYIIAGQNGVSIYNADFIVYSSTTPVFYINRVSPSMSLGTAADAMTYLGGNAGLWVGNDGGTYKMRLGSVSGGALSQGLSWDGSRLSVIGSINIGPSAGANYGVSIGNPLLMCRFDGDATGHKGQVATLTGTPTYDTTAKFGKAVVIAQATTNLCTNGDFESNTTGWSAVGAGSSISHITTFGRYGTACLKLTPGGGASAYTQNVITSDTAQKTFSAWVIAEASGTTAQIGNTGDGNSGGINLTAGVWTKISYTVTPGNATRTWYVQTNAGKVIYIDGVQLESAAAATPFVATSRTQQAISYPAANISTGAGTVSAWVALDNITATKALLSSGTNGALSILLTSTNTIQVTRKNVQTVIDTAAGMAVGVYAMVTVTWSGTTVKAYINGALLTSATAGAAFVAPASISIGTYDAASSLTFNSSIDDLFILDRALNDDEIKALYNSNAPAAIDANPYSLFLYGENNQGYVRGHATGLFGYSDTTGAAGTGAFALVTTASTALGTPFGSVTLDAGDMLIGSASTGSSNLYFDKSAGRFVIRLGTTERIAMNSSGALGIKDWSGANNVLLFSDSGGTSINQILRRLDLSGSGSITAGASFDDVIFDSTGLSLKAPPAYADINSLRWLYSSTKVGNIYAIVDTGAAVSGTLVLRGTTYSGGTHGYIDMAASSSSGLASRSLWEGRPNTATSGPRFNTTFYDTAAATIGIIASGAWKGATQGILTDTPAAFGFSYRIVIRNTTTNTTMYRSGNVAAGGTDGPFASTGGTDTMSVISDGSGVRWARAAGSSSYTVIMEAVIL